MNDLAGRVVTLKTGAQVRGAPAIDAPILREVAEPELEDAIAAVRGQHHNGSVEWLMWSAGTTFEYAHSSDVELGAPPAMADCAEAVNQAVTAALAAVGRGTPAVPGPDPVEDDDDEPDEGVL